MTMEQRLVDALQNVCDCTGYIWDTPDLKEAVKEGYAVIEEWRQVPDVPKLTEKQVALGSRSTAWLECMGGAPGVSIADWFGEEAWITIREAITLGKMASAWLAENDKENN